MASDGRTSRLENILVAIADRKSLDIFCSIAEGIGESDKLKCEKGLSRKQYYSRTGRMLRAGFIKRRRGCFFTKHVRGDSISSTA
jgi:hypothetical protein